jgi:hypothetical protein
MIKLTQDIKSQLLQLNKQSGVMLDGVVIKLIDADGDAEFQKYLDSCLEKDKSLRRKRLDITKQLQEQNKQLTEHSDENDRINEELKLALQLAEEAKKNAETAKTDAENSLDILQKKKQFELIGKIVSAALWSIGIISTAVTVMYAISIFTTRDTQMIGSTWSNTVSIVLTNAFSIVGTIMGVKYASKESDS